VLRQTTEAPQTSLLLSPPPGLRFSHLSPGCTLALHPFHPQNTRHSCLPEYPALEPAQHKTSPPSTTRRVSSRPQMFHSAPDGSDGQDDVDGTISSFLINAVYDAGTVVVTAIKHRLDGIVAPEDRARYLAWVKEFARNHPCRFVRQLPRRTPPLVSLPAARSTAHHKMANIFRHLSLPNSVLSLPR